MALSRAGLNRLTPAATTILILSANLPDMDGVSSAWGALAYLNYHRHLTHSLALAPVMALLPLLLVKPFARKPVRWRNAYLLSLLGVASHLLLDLTNVYGVRLLLPFSARWFRLDITSVIDPWIWGVLLLAVVGPALSRMIGSEIGERYRPSRTPALVALAFLLLYNCARAIIHERALAILDSRIYSGAAPRRVAAFPSAYNPFEWRGLVEGASFYSLMNLNVNETFDPTDRREFYFPGDTEAIRMARQTKVVQDFLAFSQFPAWTVTPLSDPLNGVRVELYDLRFGVSPGRGFTATVILDSQMRVLSSSFRFL